jgi:hypothetical protein
MTSVFETYLILSAAYPLVTGAWLLTDGRRRIESEVFEGSQGIRSLKYKYRLDAYRTSPLSISVGNGGMIPFGGWVLDRTEVRVAEGSAGPYLVDFTCVPALSQQKATETVNFVTKTVEWQWRWPHPRFWAHKETGVFSLEGRARVVREALWRSRPFGFVTVPAIAAGIWMVLGQWK